MSTNRLLRIGIALVVVTLVVWLGRSRREAARTTDTRQAVEVPARARDAVIAEMNTMLRSVNGVLNGAQRGDTTAVRDSATIRLARITASCVACHATYRLAVP